MSVAVADPRQTLADFVVAKNYARYLPYAMRREIYDEAIERMMNMHRVKVGRHVQPSILDDIEASLKNREILGSQRALQFGGEAILSKNLRAFNCTASFADRPRFFAEALWLLLCGCGVGFSVQRHHVEKLPAIVKPQPWEPSGEDNEWEALRCTVVVDDSIEGWADALNALACSYFEPAIREEDAAGNTFPNLPVEFDFSRIRPEGSIIASSSGKAPGPGPLSTALEAIRGVFDRCLARGQTSLRPIDVYDIMCHAAECVRSGGVRRSAMICIFSPDDVEMTYAKTGNWYDEDPQRRMSNNSARVIRSTTAREIFDALLKATRDFGEPGVSFDDSTEIVPNPCVTGETLVLTRNGNVPIKDLVGKQVDVWNGHEWSTVEPYKTGSQEIWEVETLDSSKPDAAPRKLRCTANHKWRAEAGDGSSRLLYGPKETQHLQGVQEDIDGDWLETFSTPDGVKHYLSVWSVRNTEQIEPTYCFTEPLRGQGVFNDVLTEQCHEAALDPVDRETGETGWGFCNLTTVNVATCENAAEFYRRVNLAAWLGSIQASYDDVGYLTDATRRILRRDALLGVSLTGLADNPALGFDREVLREGARIARDTNTLAAYRLGINTAARITLMKPEGTGSLVLKTSSGCTPHKAKRYLRYVEGGKISDPVIAYIADHIPSAVVPSAYTSGEYKIVFPIDLGDVSGKWLSGDTTAIEHLDRIKLLQENWADPGATRDQARHMISNTVTVRPDEWDAVGEHIWDNRQGFAGVALLGQSGDLDYAQAPFVEILTPAEIQERYGNDPTRAAKAAEAAALFERLRADWVAVDFTQMFEVQDTTTAGDLAACSAGGCLV